MMFWKIFFGARGFFAGTRVGTSVVGAAVSRDGGIVVCNTAGGGGGGYVAWIIEGGDAVWIIKGGGGVGDGEGEAVT